VIDEGQSASIDMHSFRDIFAIDGRPVDSLALLGRNVCPGLLMSFAARNAVCSLILVFPDGTALIDKS